MGVLAILVCLIFVIYKFYKNHKKSSNNHNINDNNSNSSKDLTVGVNSSEGFNSGGNNLGENSETIDHFNNK